MKIQTIPNLKTTVSKLTIMLFTVLSTQNAFSADYPEKGNFQKGSISWAENCGRCHNLRSANELTDVEWITTVFHMRVRAGLTGQETRDILTFLQESNTPIKLSTVAASSSATSTKLSGKEIYQQTCIACHGATGTGSLPGVPNFTKKDGRLSKSDKVLLEHITSGFQSTGSAMAMPPKGGNPSLSDKNIKDTLKYIRKQFGS